MQKLLLLLACVAVQPAAWAQTTPVMSDAERDRLRHRSDSLYDATMVQSANLPGELAAMKAKTEATRRRVQAANDEYMRQHPDYLRQHPELLRQHPEYRTRYAKYLKKPAR